MPSEAFRAARAAHLRASGQEHLIDAPPRVTHDDYGAPVFGGVEVGGGRRRGMSYLRFLADNPEVEESLLANV